MVYFIVYHMTLMHVCFMYVCVRVCMCVRVCGEGEVALIFRNTHWYAHLGTCIKYVSCLLY